VRIAEYYMQQTLSLYIGQMIAVKPKKVFLWGSYRWWVNKFGLNPATTGLCRNCHPCVSQSIGHARPAGHRIGPRLVPAQVFYRVGGWLP
jgi:hypothetical protein